MDYEVTYPQQRELPDWLVDKVDGDTTLAKMFYRRGVRTPQEWEQFMNLDSYQPTEPLEFNDMEETRNFIRNRINSGAKICVYGDYDADGITSTAILVKTLRKLKAEVIYHIPDRFTEGYGLDEEVIADLAQAGVDLIITCDCGISNYQEVAQAKNLGLEIVVTDHHQLPDELPPADYILSPKLLPEDHRAYYLAGAGMAYMLARALLEQDGQRAEADKFLELLAVATVADVVPLKDENRYLLKQGLNLLAAPSWPGIEALCKVCDLEPFNLGAEEIGFQLAPRLNAAGRIDTARKGVELLLAENKPQAEKLARELDEINSQRKEISNRLEAEALSQVEDVNLTEPIVLYDEDWHEGVVGIVAGRLTEKFQVPALLMCKDKDGVVTGSARSVAGVHIYQALKECSDLLLTFGGHAGAAGFSLAEENVEQFIDEIKQVLQQKLTSLGTVRELEVDDRLGFEQLGLDFYQQLQQLAPFGEGNPAPLFYSSGVEVVSHRTFSNGKHINLVLQSGGQDYTGIWWRGAEEKLGAKIDIIYSLTINQWRGQQELQLVIERVLDRQGNRTTEQVDFAWQDWRNWKQRGEVLPDFHQAVYYYEGLEEINREEQINRYQGQQAEQLVFLSCPPEAEIMREIISRVQPQEIILAYSNSELVSPNQFIKQLGGLVKNVINNRTGKVDIYKLAAVTAQREISVLLGLKYLQAKGLIELQVINPGNILVSSGSGKEKAVNSVQQKLKNLLAETKAFRNYMLTKDLDRIVDLL